MLGARRVELDCRWTVTVTEDGLGVGAGREDVLGVGAGSGCGGVSTVPGSVVAVGVGVGSSASAEEQRTPRSPAHAKTTSAGARLGAVLRDLRPLGATTEGIHSPPISPSLSLEDSCESSDPSAKESSSPPRVNARKRVDKRGPSARSQRRRRSFASSLFDKEYAAEINEMAPPDASVDYSHARPEGQIGPVSGRPKRCQRSRARKNLRQGRFRQVSPVLREIQLKPSAADAAKPTATTGPVTRTPSERIQPALPCRRARDSAR